MKIKAETGRQTRVLGKENEVERDGVRTAAKLTLYQAWKDNVMIAQRSVAPLLNREVRLYLHPRKP